MGHPRLLMVQELRHIYLEVRHTFRRYFYMHQLTDATSCSRSARPMVPILRITGHNVHADPVATYRFGKHVSDAR